MHLFTLAGMLLLSVQVPVDTAGVYGAVLQEIRREHPSTQIALSATEWDREPCGAGCPDAGAPKPHSSSVIARLRSRHLVGAVCTVPEHYVNCPGEATKLFVALGSVRSGPPQGAAPVPGGVWIDVTTIAPCGGECRVPEVIARRFLLTRCSDGRWRVAAKRPESIS
jgi:hypothetical protein